MADALNENFIHRLNVNAYDDLPNAVDNETQQILSYLVEKNASASILSLEYSSIGCCQNRMLRYSLMFYSFIPNSKSQNKLYFIIKWIHRLLMLISLSMGFYSIEGITHSNHGSVYLTLILDFVYPLFYCASLSYFTKSTHFWKLCSIRSFVMTHYAHTYVTCFLIFGLSASLGLATWQKLVWKDQHLQNHQYDIYFAIWIVFAVTMVLRIYILFLAAMVFWITARFHQRQIKIYLRNIRAQNAVHQGNKLSLNAAAEHLDNEAGNRPRDIPKEEQYRRIFNSLLSIKSDMDYTNKSVQTYLSVFLISILISLIVLVAGMLLSWIDLKVFINNSSDLFLMALIALYILWIAAKTTQTFNDISDELKKYYHQQIAFRNWKPQEIMLLFLYSESDQSGFRLFGVILDYGTVMRFFVVLVSGFLSTFGKKFYS
eukprot:383409_1